MSSSDINQTSAKIIDMLVGTTLKNHNAQLDSQKLSDEEREQIKQLVEDLKQSVESLQKKPNSTNEK